MKIVIIGLVMLVWLPGIAVGHGHDDLCDNDKINWLWLTGDSRLLRKGVGEL